MAPAFGTDKWVLLATTLFFPDKSVSWADQTGQSQTAERLFVPSTDWEDFLPLLAPLFACAAVDKNLSYLLLGLVPYVCTN